MKKLFTLTFALLFAATSFAQIPNNSMENWQTQTGTGLTGPFNYEIPQNWELGFVSGLFAGFGLPPNIEKSTTSRSGNFSLQLSSDADSIGADIVSVFGLGPNMRPQTFDGFFQTSGVVNNPDAYAQAFVFLTKWSGAKTDTIGYGMAELDNAPNGFKPFSTNIQYSGTANPDSAIIYIFYFPQAGNTHILLDDLSFNSVLGMKETTTFSELTFFPNPVSGNQPARLTFNAQKAGNAHLTIRDVTGKEVMQMPLHKLQAGRNSIEIATSQLQNGLYIATLQSEKGSQVFRFVKR